VRHLVTQPAKSQTYSAACKNLVLVVVPAKVARSEMAIMFVLICNNALFPFEVVSMRNINVWLNC